MSQKNAFLFLLFLLFHNPDLTAEESFIGLFWGAFDPPTEAHQAIIESAVKSQRFHQLILIVNNTNYKEYTFSLSERVHKLKRGLPQTTDVAIQILVQDDVHKISCKTIKAKFPSAKLCVIAGYDSYRRWRREVRQDTAEEDAIAVIPRGLESPKLYEEQAFLLPIPQKYRMLSSTALKQQKKRELPLYTLFNYFKNSLAINSDKR